MISGRGLLEKFIEFKTLGNSALMKLPEVTFFPSLLEVTSYCIFLKRVVLGQSQDTRA